MDTMKLELDVARIVEAWRSKEGNLIMILHQVQNLYGYVPREASFQIAKMLDFPLAAIYEVITFYNYFKLVPPGRHTISVCMGTACYLKGSLVLLDEVKSVLDISEGETTKDGMFHLQVVRCLGCCGLSPVITVDGAVYSKVRRNDIIDIISKHSDVPVSALKAQEMGK